MLTDKREEQPLKASLPISVHDEGMSTCPLPSGVMAQPAVARWSCVAMRAALAKKRYRCMEFRADVIEVALS